MNTVTDELAKLISFPTITGDRGAADELIDYVREQMEPLLQIESGEFNNYPYIIGYTKSPRTPKLLLVAHLDVVPASEDQFTMRKEGDRLTGRGTFDMKFGAACYLELLRDMGEDIKDLDVAILFVFDEENGGFDGMGPLVHAGLKPTVGFLPDGGDNFDLEKIGKGVWQAKLTKVGEPAHGSRPWEGDSPVSGLLQCLLEIEAAFDGQKRETDTCAITTLGGGDSSNRTPKEVYATLDLRFISRDTLKESLEKIESICQVYDVAIEVTEDTNSFETGVNSQYVQLYQDIFKQKTGREMKHQIVCGSADTRYLSDVGVPVVMTRPAGGNAHGDNEWVSERGLLDFYDILKEFVVQCMQ